MLSHVGIEVPQQNDGVPERGTIRHLRQGHQEDCTPHHCLGHRPKQWSETSPNPKTQRCDPLIHWGKAQDKTAELGATSTPTLPAASPRAPLQRRKSPASLE
ncbi:hypothetical protein ATANTOWER_016340 [Ataeniobius toweri]|uniref:Uncharacterized protein n=1 Tax=Ataeniobius toweri TaxID=208326 RepID=A0ABU7AAG3_9TELE|nr:hypothetical protein [Ataeniobius toweri]